MDPNAAASSQETRILSHDEHPDGSHPDAHHAKGVQPANGMRLLERMVLLVRQNNGSDIHLLEGERPRARVRGDLRPVEDKAHPLVTRSDIEEILSYALTPQQKKSFEEHADIDFSLNFQDATGRFNVGLTNGRRLYLAMRYLRKNIIPIDELGIDPDMLRKAASADSGLIMVVGETSSGKTTTIAAMLDHINHTRLGAITTIENPVEYVLHSDHSLITQREVGRDTPDFHTALRAIVRKNPDVVLIGEIRDAETANIALSASETGIQTFCTLHALGAIPAILRLAHIMLAANQDEGEFYNRLSNVLRFIIFQQLVRTADNSAVLPVYEIMNVTEAERNYIRQKDIGRLEHSIESDHSISLGKCLYKLWHQDPRRINEATVRQVYGDQTNLILNRLHDVGGWRSPLTGM